MSVVTVTATVEADSVPPRVRLDVTDIGSPNLFAVTVTRLDPDGRTVPVRTTDGNPLPLITSGANRVGLLYDYEMPYGSAVSYSTVESPTTTSVEVVVDELRAWLIHPGVPVLSMPITVQRLGERKRGVQRGLLYPMGRATPIVQTTGVRQAAEYNLSILTFTDQEYRGLDALLADAGPLLLNVPALKGWGFAAEYVAVGDVTESRLSRIASEPSRTWDLNCTVVDRPAGGSQSERSYVDLLTFASYADLLVAYPTYLDLLAGP
jgi:hypothetical protein